VTEPEEEKYVFFQSKRKKVHLHNIKKEINNKKFVVPVNS
jgi:hypothetical protein